MGSLASQAELGVWVSSPGALQLGPAIITTEKIEIVYAKS